MTSCVLISTTLLHLPLISVVGYEQEYRLPSQSMSTCRQLRLLS